jgi:hypothetical protein
MTPSKLRSLKRANPFEDAWDKLPEYVSCYHVGHTGVEYNIVTD